MNKQYIREKINPVLLCLYKTCGIEIKDSLLLCPQENKRKYIKETYIKRPDISTFIETGTWMGDTVNFVINDFKNIYSIELSEEYANKAKLRFKNKTNVKIIAGDSAKELPTLIKQTDGPCVFWLDGHYSYGNTAKSNKETPILEELRPVLKMEQDHIILIDDARLFIGTHNYPWLLNLARFVRKTNPKYKMIISNDIITLIKK